MFTQLADPFIFFFIVVLQKKFKWGRLKQKRWYSAISLFDNQKLNWWMINESFFRLCNRQLVLSLWSECILRRWNYNLVKPNHTEEIVKPIEEQCLAKWWPAIQCKVPLNSFGTWGFLYLVVRGAENQTSSPPYLEWRTMWTDLAVTMASQHTPGNHRTVSIVWGCESCEGPCITIVLHLMCLV